MREFIIVTLKQKADDFEFLTLIFSRFKEEELGRLAKLKRIECKRKLFDFKKPELQVFLNVYIERRKWKSDN